MTRWVYRVVGTLGFAAVACNYARAPPSVRPNAAVVDPGSAIRRYIINVVGDGLGSAFLLYLYLGAIYWFSFAILATCVDVTPKAAPGTAAPASSAAYQKIPTGGLRV